MALKAFVENLDSVDEALHEHYTERDGGFHLSLEDFGKHYGAVSLKTTLNKVNKDKEALAIKVGELEGKLEVLPEDFDVDEWARLKAGVSDDKDPDAKKRFDEQLQSQRQILEQKLANTVKAKDAEIAARDVIIAERDGYIDRTLAETGLKDALLDVGVNPDLVEGALASLRPSVKVMRDDATGERKAIVETDLGEVDVPAFVKDWSATKGKAYLAKAAPMDANGNNGGGRNAKTPSGNFGGDRNDRVKAIAGKFPELAQK
ncbi:hypothetical protein [Mesorhizobium amorphae]|uniref:hypothetical protein n=1 Tax=Mesorhizobium amorphae TaxID=71433 RepID=UPI001183ED2E|nr:hypothetical protein [Mesorhizobium amorphae]